MVATKTSYSKSNLSNLCNLCLDLLWKSVRTCNAEPCNQARSRIRKLHCIGQDNENRTIRCVFYLRSVMHIAMATKL